jgi:hypothetical protein
LPSFYIIYHALSKITLHIIWTNPERGIYMPKERKKKRQDKDAMTTKGAGGVTAEFPEPIKQNKKEK